MLGNPTMYGSCIPRTRNSHRDSCSIQQNLLPLAGIFSLGKTGQNHDKITQRTYNSVQQPHDNAAGMPFCVRGITDFAPSTHGLHRSGGGLQKLLLYSPAPEPGRWLTSDSEDDGCVLHGFTQTILLGALCVTVLCMHVLVMCLTAVLLLLFCCVLHNHGVSCIHCCTITFNASQLSTSNKSGNPEAACSPELYMMRQPCNHWLPQIKFVCVLA